MSSSGFVCVCKSVVKRVAQFFCLHCLAIRSATIPASSCSQTCNGFHPKALSSRSFLASRSRFAAILSAHHLAFALGATACSGHPCQKHPSTKMTNRSFTITISGRPGRSRRCSRNRTPRRWSSRRSWISGVVFATGMRFMNSLTEALDAGGDRRVFGGIDRIVTIVSRIFSYGRHCRILLYLVHYCSVWLGQNGLQKSVTIRTQFPGS